MSRKYKDANKWLIRFCLNYLLKKSEKLSGSTKRFVKEDLRYLYYKFGLFEYWEEK